jgi:D-sedoheptulose 7-phosphate isomerase
MSSEQWQDHVEQVYALLKAVTIRNRQGRSINAQAGFEHWRSLTAKLRRRHGTIFLIGNGASASMASHMAADLAKNGGLHTEVFSDLSLITAISNDMGYEHVFSEPLSRRVRRGDMLVAISSSGKSPNVLAAVKVAIRAKTTVVTLSAMGPKNPLQFLGDLNIYVPARTYGFAESCHATILHHWMDLVEEG